MSLPSEIMAFVATAQPDAAKAFYRDRLGFTLVEDSRFALVFVSGVTTLRVQKVGEVRAAAYTALGWRVPDIAASVAALEARGVVFERVPGFSDTTGIWTAPNGDKVAWFQDPDGNILSLTQFAG
jgi:catechol 2,3-dioxygenase-like lactoylglutathione lyase family enzyme